MEDLELLKQRLDAIEHRNKTVESDKAWEVSYTRRGLLILFTYLSIGLYMWAIAVPQPWLSAIVPSVGFLLSTLTLPYVKRWWIQRRKNDN